MMKKYKTFITQSPFRISMFDNEMRLLAASQKSVDDNKLQNKNLADSILNELFPNAKSKWNDIHASCLEGNINRGEEEHFEREDGSPGWLRWDIRPWYSEKEEVGGLLIFTEDITAVKLKDAENRIISDILHKTNELARIGAWQRDFGNNKTIWSNITKEILEVSDDFEPNIDTSFNFYKEGRSRNLVKRVFQAAIIKGESFDIEAEIISAKGNLKKVRVIGFPEFYNGKCEKLSGILQDITNITNNDRYQ